jgi:hypothetical protein
LQLAALDAGFIAGYQKERLARFDSRNFVEQLGPGARVVDHFKTPVARGRALAAADKPYHPFE